MVPRLTDIAETHKNKGLSRACQWQKACADSPGLVLSDRGGVGGRPRQPRLWSLPSKADAGGCEFMRYSVEKVPGFLSWGVPAGRPTRHLLPSAAALAAASVIMSSRCLSGSRGHKAAPPPSGRPGAPQDTCGQDQLVGPHLCFACQALRSFLKKCFWTLKTFES